MDCPTSVEIMNAVKRGDVTDLANLVARGATLRSTGLVTAAVTYGKVPHSDLALGL